MSDPAANYYPQADPGYSLQILVPPKPFYRLRYVSESKNARDGPKMKSFHGPLKGLNASYPKVQLQHRLPMEEESETEIFIRVSVFTASCQPHVHQIAIKESGTTDWQLKNHADFNVSSLNNFTAEFSNLIIIRRTEAEWIKEAVTRQKCGIDLQISEEEFKTQAEQFWQSLEHTQFRLGFYAYKRSCPDLLCEPVFSDLISNEELNICNISPSCGKKGDQLFLLVSKIESKSKVRVRFFEGDPIKPSWEEYVQKIDFHYHVVLIVLVPTYREDIQAKIQVQLERTNSDGSINRSEARTFIYYPSKQFGKRSLPTPPNCSRHANERRSRTTGGSLSEEHIQVQRWGQQLNTVQSCPNVYGQSQGCILQSSLGEGSSSSQNMHQLLNEIHLSDSQGLIQSSEDANSFEPNNQQYSGPQVAEYQSMETNLDWEQIFSLLDDSKSPKTYRADLAADSTDEKKKLAGKEKHNVVTDGVSKSNASGSKSLDHNKDMSCTAAAVKHTMPSLFQIAMTGDARKLEELLTKTEMNTLINERNDREQTPLNIAVQQNHYECVQLLCSAGANVVADEEENTPYHIAAKENYYKCLETLLEVEDRELDKKNNKGQAALHLAVQYNNIESVRMLIKAGANVNEKNYTAGLTPLHLAVQHGYTELVRHLLEQENIKIDEVNYAHKTAAALVKADQRDIINLFKELQGITLTIEEETTDEDE